MRGRGSLSNPTMDADSSDSGEEYIPLPTSRRRHRRRSRLSSISARSSEGSMVPNRSSLSTSMTSVTSAGSRVSRQGGPSEAGPSDEDISSEMESSETDADTKRLREPSFNMVPEMSGCLLQLAVDVCRKLREGGDTRNVLVSPFMVASSLVMLLHGCESHSPSADALGRALHVHWAPLRMARAFDRQAQALFAPFRRPKLRVQRFSYTCFMSLCYDQRVQLTGSYLQLQERLSYLLDRRDFAHSAEQCRLSMDAMARAVSSFSFKAGEEIFPPGSVDEKSLLVLLSSIRLEGTWRYSFQAAWGDFHETPEAAITIGMMRQKSSFRMYRCSELEVTALELPYENRDVSLVILLPARLDGLAALEKRATAARLLHCVAMLEECQGVTVCMPRLRLRSVTDLSPVLRALGLGVLFTDEARFRYLSKVEGVHLSSVRHVAVLHVNRKGARQSKDDIAAASKRPSVGAVSVVSPPSTTGSSSVESPLPLDWSTADMESATEEASSPQFVVDRPFMLLVLKRRPDIVLLLGSVKKLIPPKL